MAMVKRYVEFIEGRDPFIKHMDETIKEVEENLKIAIKGEGPYKGITELMKDCYTKESANLIALLHKQREERIDRCFKENLYFDEFLATN